jgi:HSP20 family protein
MARLEQERRREMWPAQRRRRSNWGEEFVPSVYSLNRWLSELWENLPESPSLVGTYPVDIDEHDDTVTVEAEMPGFKKDEITVTVEGDVMRISAERESKKTEGHRHLRERHFSKVDRVLTLPSSVDEHGAHAQLEDGVLRIELPKAEGSRSHTIDVR